jgi:hypothetical protein
MQWNKEKLYGIIGGFAFESNQMQKPPYNHPGTVKGHDDALPFRWGGCGVIASRWERQSGSKALECGPFRLWEIVACIKSKVFLRLARLSLNG